MHHKACLGLVLASALAGCGASSSIAPGAPLAAPTAPVGTPTTAPSGGTPSSPATAKPTSAPTATIAPTVIPTTAPTTAPTVAPTAVTTSQASPPTTPPMATVGTTGNEPLLAEDPDGTLFLSALTNLYRSENGGVTWTLLPPPSIALTVLASDSSIAFSPSGLLYYTFDYPYAGTTAACTSPDHGTTFTCNPAVAPGGTDRMWITAPDDKDAYETTNEGLYETVFLDTSDSGTVWLPEQIGDNVLEPDTGPLLESQGSNVILQVLDEHPGRYVYRYVVSSGVLPQLANAVNTGVASDEALPSSVQDTSGNFYLVGAPANPAMGQAVQVARSSDHGQTYTLLPPIPQTLTGTATFTAMAAGAAGHIAVVYYSSPTDGTDPPSMNATWSAQVAETYDAMDAIPVWTVTQLEASTHVGGLCANAGCSGDTRYSGDFISAVIDPAGHLNVTWMDEPGAAKTPTIRFARLH